MKVLALVHKYPPVHCAGAEMMLHAMLRDLLARGHDVEVMYPGAKPRDYQGVQVSVMRDDHWVVRAAREADVLFTHLDVTAKAVKIAQMAKRPLVHLVHNDAQLQYHQVREDGAALVVWNSAWIAHSYRNWPGPSMVVTPPVAVADYAAAERRGRDAISLLNLTQAKGAGLFFEVAARMTGRRFLGVQGAYGIQMKPKRRLPNFEFVAHTADVVEDVYARTRLLFVPSSYESWGRVAIEACCSGIPVLAHPTAGLKESLGPAGIFCDRRHERVWRQQVERLDDVIEYAEASERARDRAVELEALSRVELDAFAGRLDEVVAAKARA
jgi:glycosyltransferase involved in cell wall biosynthesis